MLGHLITVRSRTGLILGLAFLLVGFALAVQVGSQATACGAQPVVSGSCAQSASGYGNALVVAFVVMLAGAAVTFASLLLSTRGMGVLFLLLGVIIGVNDMVSGGSFSLDGFFHWGDLVDSLSNGTIHHEPFVLAFIVLGLTFLGASFVMPSAGEIPVEAAQ